MGLRVRSFLSLHKGPDHSLKLLRTIHLGILVVSDRLDIVSSLDTLYEKVDRERTSVGSGVGWVVHIRLANVVEEPDGCVRYPNQHGEER
jgi:hypothetical protein